MKCKYCDGTGTTNLCVNGIFINCSHCGGAGEVKMTNEEWFATLSTEEKARFLEMICYSAWGDKNSRFKDMANYIDWVEWLKQPHR